MKKIFIDFFEKNKFEIIYSNYADFIAKAKIQPDTDEGEERPEEYQYFLLKFAFIESDNLFNIKKSIRLLHENSSKFICSKKYERNNKINMCLVLNKYPLPKIKQFLESLERDDFLILWLEDGYFEGFEKSNNIIHGQPSIIIDEESMYEI